MQDRGLRKTKIGTEVAHVTRDSDTTLEVKRSKVNLQGAETYCGGLPHSLLISKLPAECYTSKEPLLFSMTGNKIMLLHYLVALYTQF